MPNYVDDPENPGTLIGDIQLQKRDPLKPLPAYGAAKWLALKTWTGRDACMLLAGYSPEGTDWGANYGGEFVLPPERIVYLDRTLYINGRNALINDEENKNLNHPLADTCADNFRKLSWCMSKEGLQDERKTPKEWVNWAEEKGITAYWEEHREPSQAPMTAKAERGITKSQVIAAFTDIYWTGTQWQNNLGNPRQWLMDCRVTRGVKGKHVSATWNPVLIAVALFDKRGVPILRLDAVFSSKLQAWKEEWDEVSATFR